MGKTTLAKFGGIFGCHSESGSLSGSATFWSLYSAGHAWTHRISALGTREIPNTTVTTSAGFNTLTNFRNNANAIREYKKSKFSSTQNISATTVDPIKAGDATPSVIVVGTAGAGDDALVWNTTDKPENARWKAAVIANAFPDIFPLSAIMPGNEPPGNSARVCAYGPGHVGETVTVFNNNNALDLNTVLVRLILILKNLYIELKTPQRKYCKLIHPSPLTGYQNNGSFMKPNRGGDAYTAYDMFNFNSGEILNYCSAITTHIHNTQSLFDLTSGANDYSYYHLWTAIRQGETASGTLGDHCVCNDETGVRSGDHLSNPPDPLGLGLRSQWTDPPTAANEQARLLITTRRLGFAAVAHFFWGLAHAWVWAHNITGAGDFIGFSFYPAPNYIPIQPKATLLDNAYAAENYMISGRSPWQLSITAKPWADLTNDTTTATRGFHYGPTWAILANVIDTIAPSTNQEKANPTSTTNPTWYEWDRATITNNNIAFTAPVAGNGRQINQACRPVVLPGHGKYYITCRVSGNTGIARIIARGYDLTNGLAHTLGLAGSETTNATATLTTSFTCVPHTVKNFPNMPRVVVLLECTKAASFSDVVLSSRPIETDQVITVPPLNVVATGNPTSGNAPLAVAFTSAASGGVGNYSYSWAFGDSTNSTLQNPSHTYSSAGNRSSVVTASSGGDTATDSVAIIVTSSQNEQDIFLNPFSYTSAHHRPIGTGATYAGDNHAVTTTWQTENFSALNVGAPYGRSMFQNSSNDPIKNVADSGRLVGLNLPWNNHHIPNSMNIGVAGTDSNVLLFDYQDGLVHEFYGWEWNNGAPSAAAHRSWDPKGNGHSASKTGFSASGVGGGFGIVRGHEINTNSGEIMHAMQIVKRGNSTPMHLANAFVWPAISTDGFCNGTTTCTGNIKYGYLFALPQDTYTDNFIDTQMGLSDLGKRLARQMRNYGGYIVDNAAGSPSRADQFVTSAKRTEFVNQMRIIYPNMRWVTNNASAQTASGGGTAIAPNGAFDAP